MPLQGKQPFQRKILKGVEHRDQELFYCDITKEAFTDYEEFFERCILCKSMIWSCEVTGRGGMTFQEALVSEDRARQTLKAIPWLLKHMILSLVEKCKSHRLNELSEKIYDIVRNYFVIGETVEAVIEKTKKTCEVVDVLSPGASNKSKSPLKKSSDSPKKTSPSKVRYEVCEKDSEIQILHVVSADNISRSKGSLTKDKTKLFLKQTVELQDGILKVKNGVSEKFKLNNATSTHIPGKKTKAEKTLKKGTPLKNGDILKKGTPGKISPAKAALKNCQSPSKIKKTLKSFDSDIRKIFPKDYTKLTSLVKESNKVVLTEKDSKLEEAHNKKLKMKEKMENERKLLNQYMAEWKKKRDDLECDDLEDLPSPTPINLGIPRDLFGEAVAVMEFVHQFGSLLKVKNSFSNGLNLELMERALTETDIQGPFNDLLQMLLLTVFKQQEHEEEELDTTSTPSTIIDDTDLTTASAIKSANLVASWPMMYHNCLLRQFPLDPFTLSELLRLHILTSGADISTLASDRGQFKNKEDPGLDFKIKNQSLLKTMAESSVYLLPPEQRLHLMQVLIDQLLTYPAFRDHLEIHLKNLNSTRYKLKKLYVARKKILKKTVELETNIGAVEGNEIEMESVVKLESSEISNSLTEDEKAELAEFPRKEKDLKATISKILQVFRVEPLGTDRAYRSFWKFSTIEGLFVEDTNPQAGKCLSKATPTQVVIRGGLFPQDEIPLSFMSKFLRGIDKNSDKENKLSKSNPKSNVSQKKLLNDANASIDTPLKSNNKKSAVFGLCTANPSTCPVHSVNNVNRISWSFFSKESDLDNLISNLNPRGFRECVLKRNLVKEGISLKDWIKKCPSEKLNILEPIGEEAAVEQRKSTRLYSNKNNFAGMHPEEALELTLRESILDNEDKVWAGGLGTLKVKDRNAWRTAIDNNEYDPQCDDLPAWTIDPLQPPRFIMNDNASTSCSPTPPPSVKNNVKDLASAIIQVANSVQSRFIRGPLAENDEYRKQMEKVTAEIEKRKCKEEIEGVPLIEKQNWRSLELPRSPMARWTESIQSCSSLSQLFLHLITLESSITWNRSALRASCRVCRKKGDGENMLLCDKCDKGFHMYCLKPPLKEIPSCEWFCLACIPPPPKVEKKQERRTLSYEEESEPEQESVLEDEDEGEEDFEYVPNGKKPKRDTKNVEDRDENHSKCTSCRKRGQLICCDGCPESLHLRCAKPRLHRVPRGTWYCHKCVKKGKRSSTSQNSPNVNLRSSRSSEKRKLDSGTGRSTANSRNVGLDLMLNVNACEEVITALSRHSECWPFLKQGVKKKGNYSRVVKRPIDIETIRSKLSNMSYSSNNQFVADVYLMFQNCEVYNPVKSEENKASKSLTRYFQTLLRRFKLEDIVPNGELSEKRPRRSF